VILADLKLKGGVPFATGALNNLLTLAPVQQKSHGRYKPFLLRHRITDMDSGSGRANDSMWFKTVRSSSANYHNLWSKMYILARPPNAAPEWQARRLRQRCRALRVACPLEGLVMPRKIAFESSLISKHNRAIRRNPGFGEANV
jgi:hypothetical protein